MHCRNLFSVLYSFSLCSLEYTFSIVCVCVCVCLNFFCFLFADQALLLVKEGQAKMQPGGDKPTNFPGRPASPFSAPSQSSIPLRPSGPLAGLGATGAPQTSMPFLASGAGAGPELSTHRGPAPSVRFNGPSSPPPQSSFSSQTANVYQQTQPPRFPPPAQPVPPLLGPSPVGLLGIHPPGSIQPQPQVPSVPMNFPLQIANQMPPRGNMPTQVSDSPFSATRRPSQPPMHGYPNVLPRVNAPQASADSQFTAPRSNTEPPFQAFQAAHVSAGQPSFSTYQGGQVTTTPPPVEAPIGFNYRGRYPTAGPPIGGTLQNLVEDFQSLSVGSAPGSLDPGVDQKSLPRPLNDDDELTPLLETYPFNCHPRFLRLTTHAIPSSQSLLARWHLPLGAVIHPLAEVPDGVSSVI